MFYVASKIWNPPFLPLKKAWRSRRKELYAFQKAIIPTFDKVIPTQNQHNYWEKQPDTKIKTVECGHYPFFALRNWSEIING